jgi:ABC-2 type transport system permease protein
MTTTGVLYRWRVFWASALFAPKTTLGFMRVDFVLGEIFILPFTQMVFFAFVATLAHNPTANVAYVTVGNAIATVTYTSVWTVSFTTSSEKSLGTMEPLLVTPASRPALFSGRTVVPILLSLATVSVGLLYAVAVFHAPFSSGGLGDLAVSLVLIAVSMVGFGLLIAGVALFLRTSIILANLFLFIGLLLSGVNFPISQLPAPLAAAGELFPLTWGVAAVRTALAGAPLGAILPQWGILGLEGVVSYGLALGLWSVFERRALRTGSIVRF